jgi:hypothetical protein
MAGDRTLSLKLLADTKNLTDGLNKGAKATESFGDQMTAIGKKVATAFAAMGAAASAFAYASIKNALEDQAAQRKLEETIRASTNATAAQTKAVGEYIDKTSIAIGVTDDQLRPALARLIRSTNDIKDAQNLLNLALDITAATGKPLEAVTNALGKAYDGNLTSLGRLGLGLDASTLKSKDFNKVFEQLTSTFGNFAENEAETTAKKFERLKIVVDEAKEQIGVALLPVVERLGDWLINVGVPNLQAFVDGLTGQRGVTVAISNANKGAYDLGERLKNVFETVYRLKEEFAALAGVIASLWVVAKIAAFIQGINALVKAFQAWRTAAAGAAVATGAATGGISAGAAVAGAGAVALGLAGILSQIDRGGEDGGDVSGTNPLGNFQMSTGTFLGGSTGTTGFNAGNLTSYTPPSGGKSLAELSKGLVTSPQDLISRLQSTSSRISDIQFALDTGQISKAKAAALLKPIETEFNMLQRVAESLQTSSTPYNTTSAEELRFRQGERGSSIIINVNAPSVIDENGFSRAVQNAIQNAEARGTYAGGL